MVWVTLWDAIQYGYGQTDKRGVFAAFTAPSAAGARGRLSLDGSMGIPIMKAIRSTGGGWRKPSGPQGPFFMRSQQLLPKAPFASPVVLVLKNRDDLFGERRGWALDELALPKNLMAARMGQQIANLEA